MATLPDFKDPSGNWVMTCFDGDKNRYFTVSGQCYNALQNRTRKVSAVHKTRPLYAGCTSLFRDFQHYADWATQQIGYGKGFHLEKDILIRGNKVYSETTCIFVPLQINALLLKNDAKRGEYPIGVSKAKSKFAAHCKNGDGKPREYLGNFNTTLEAFAAYKKYKEQRIKEEALKWRDQIDPRAFDALLAYEVLITD